MADPHSKYSNHGGRPLDTFPPEILMMIAKKLKDNEDRLSLMLCSRQMHVTVEPVLYKSIKFADNISKRTVARLLRTILQYPLLASCITELDLGLWDWTAPYKGPFTMSNVRTPKHIPDRPCLRPRYARLEKVIASVSHQQEEWTWLQDLKEGLVGAYLALLLVSAPNLKKPKITQFPPNSPYFFEMVRRTASREHPFHAKPILTSLSHFELSSRFSAESDVLKRFLELPAINTLVATNIGRDWIWTQKCMRSQIRHIELKDSSCIGSIGLMLQGCNRLRSFSYTHNSSFKPIRIDIVSIWEGLQVTRDTLEKPCLDLPRGRDLFEVVWPVNPPLTFSHFRSLKNLAFPAVQLLDMQDYSSHSLAEMLSESLVQLVLLDVPLGHLDFVTSEVEQLAGSAIVYMPHLATIILRGDFPEKRNLGAPWTTRPDSKVISPTVMVTLGEAMAECSEAGIAIWLILSVNDCLDRIV